MAVRMAPLRALLVGGGFAALLIVLLVAPAQAIPTIPNQFWGTLAVNGVAAPDGSQVSGKIEGIEYGRGITSGGTYSVIVLGDDPDTAAKEGGGAGQQVLLHAKGFRSTEWMLGGQGTFEHGAVTRLNLALSDTVPPTVSIDAVSSPTTLATVLLTGSFSDAFIKEARVERTGATIAVASLPSDGKWSATVNLVLGTNELTVRAVDLAGNTGAATVTIVSEAPAPTPTPTPTATPGPTPTPTPAPTATPTPTP
ncbi:MAG: hypothetical protein Q8O76_15060, partial [Chloroflexota bacterium]|nr:hypothetical protein [Chloroflexota bacterium]